MIVDGELDVAGLDPDAAVGLQPGLSSASTEINLERIRLLEGSPPGVSLRLRPSPAQAKFGVTLELGGIDGLFTPISAGSPPADVGVRQRLQALGYPAGDRRLHAQAGHQPRADPRL